MASKKDFLSPAVVALPVLHCRKGLGAGLWFRVPEAFFIFLFLFFWVSILRICEIMMFVLINMS